MKPNANDPQFMLNRIQGLADPEWRIGGYLPSDRQPMPDTQAYPSSKGWDYIGSTNYKQQNIRWYTRRRTLDERTN